MDDVRDLLDDAASDFTPRARGTEQAFERARRRRNRSRVAAAVVAFAVAAFGIGGTLWAFSSGTPVATPSNAPASHPGPGPTTGGAAPGCAGGWAQSAVPAPGNETNVVSGVAALSPDDAWAVGWYTHIPTSWLTPRPPGSDGPGPPELIVPVAMHWDGAAWTPFDVPNADVVQPGSDSPEGGVRLLAVAAAAPDDAWAVGGGQGPRIEHWDGTKWSIVPSPDVNLVDGELVGVAATGPDDAWAIGSGGDNGGIAPVIEHWDGRTWSVTPVPDVGTRYSMLSGIDALSPDDAWAVGQEWNRPLALHWDGTTWTRVPVPNLRAIRLGGVAMLASSDVWAAGTDYADVDGHGPSHAVLAHWDGSSWSLVQTPLAGASSFLGDISAAGPNRLWARGAVAPVEGDVGDTAVVRFDGTTWREVDAPANSPETGSWSGIGGVPDGSAWLVGSTTTPAGLFPFGNPFVARSCGP